MDQAIVTWARASATRAASEPKSARAAQRAHFRRIVVDITSLPFQGFFCERLDPNASDSAALGNVDFRNRFGHQELMAAVRI
jgi:hypothetical protein